MTGLLMETIGSSNLHWHFEDNYIRIPYVDFGTIVFCLVVLLILLFFALVIIKTDKNIEEVDKSKLEKHTEFMKRLGKLIFLCIIIFGLSTGNMVVDKSSRIIMTGNAINISLFIISLVTGLLTLITLSIAYLEHGFRMSKEEVKK